jgi:hypothetical protein
MNADHTARTKPATVPLSHAQRGILSDTVRNEIHDHFNGCRLCWAISGSGQRFPSNTILFRSPGAVVLPGLGSMLEGYVLLTSSQHEGCMATLSRDRIDVVTEAVRKALARVQAYSSQWCVAEHGNSFGGKHAANTIDHLHLHFVPLGFDIVGRSAHELGTDPVRIESPRDLPDVVGKVGKNYLYLRDANGDDFVLFSDRYPSQFIRRLVAAHVNDELGWDWKERPYEPTILDTLASFKACGLLPASIYFAHSIEGRSDRQVEDDVSRYRELLKHAGCYAQLVSMFEVFERRFFSPNYFRNGDLPEILVETELAYLQACDLMLVDLSIPGHQYVGAMMEIAYAREAGIPVVAVTGDSSVGSRLWLKAHCDVIVHAPEEAIPWVTHFLDRIGRATGA